MTIYNVHIYRELKLKFDRIEAETPEAAASIAWRDRPTDETDDIDDCDGETFSALVDVVGDEEYEQTRLIDFEGERLRQAAPALLAGLEGIIDYAENEAHSLESLKDSPEAEAEAERAWKAIEVAHAAIEAAKAAGIQPTEVDVHGLLAGRRQIAAIWGIDDVKAVRPELTDQQAWEVLQIVDERHDAEIGINWPVLKCHANELYGNPPETDEPEEE